jgi:hypothetical protein
MLGHVVPRCYVLVLRCEAEVSIGEVLCERWKIHNQKTGIIVGDADESDLWVSRVLTSNNDADLKHSSSFQHRTNKIPKCLA